MRSTKIYLVTDIEEFDKYKVYIGKSCRLETRQKLREIALKREAAKRLK